MRQRTPITNQCTPEKKAIHMELTYQMNEKKRMLNEADYDYEKGVITLVERTKLYTQIVMEYEELRKKLIANIN